MNALTYPPVPFVVIGGVAMLKLQMFTDQNQGGGSRGSRGHGVAVLDIPFKNWKVGYVLRTQTNAEEDWTIKTIESEGGVMKREDCTVSLVNKAAELRTVKGSTLQSSYKFVSTGDVEPPAVEERVDVRPFAAAVSGIREFYPRTHGEGTRILMLDKTAYIVADSFFSIWDAYCAAGQVDAARMAGREKK